MSNAEGLIMLPEQALSEFYKALDGAKVSIQSSMERLSEKIEEMRSNMPTHRDIDDLKNRMSKNEATTEMLRSEMARRNEVESLIREHAQKVAELDKRLNDFQIIQGRLPQWVWPTIIGIAVSVFGWFMLHPVR